MNRQPDILDSKAVRTGIVRLRKYHWQISPNLLTEFWWYHFQVKRVYYPGLKSHPEHHIAVRQMTGFGGVVSFEVGLVINSKCNWLTFNTFCHMLYISLIAWIPHPYHLLYRLMVTYIPLRSSLTIWKFHTLPLPLEDARALWTSQQSCLTGLYRISSQST